MRRMYFIISPASLPPLSDVRMNKSDMVICQGYLQCRGDVVVEATSYLIIAEDAEKYDKRSQLPGRGNRYQGYGFIRYVPLDQVSLLAYTGLENCIHRSPWYGVWGATDAGNMHTRRG